MKNPKRTVPRDGIVDHDDDAVMVSIAPCTGVCRARRFRRTTSYAASQLQVMNHQYREYRDRIQTRKRLRLRRRPRWRAQVDVELPVCVPTLRPALSGAHPR
jgi:hypothetical protein